MACKDLRTQGRLNKVTLENYSDAKLLELWTSNSLKRQLCSNAAEAVPFSDCHIWSGSTQNGYPSLSMGHATSKVKVHILALWTVNGATPDSGQVSSHLCHRKRCINPSHLVLESITCNNSRKGCLCALQDLMGNVWTLCPHNPKCLRRDTDTVGNFIPHVLSPAVTL